MSSRVITATVWVDGDPYIVNTVCEVTAPQPSATEESA